MSNSDLEISSLQQLTCGEDWRFALAHDREENLLVWITRGQGRLLLGGRRRGVGPHNAIVVPARHLFALDLGRQGSGQAIVVPAESGLPFPQVPALLRIRDASTMMEIATLLEATTREQELARPLSQTALAAHGSLISVWLQRQIGLEEHIPPKANAATRLTASYAQRISQYFREPMTMADHAMALQVTPTHLTRACKAATGRTAAELLTERILYEARSLLVSTKVPAQDIARFLGFGSAAYFTRFILQHTNATPSTLRKAAA